MSLKNPLLIITFLSIAFACINVRVTTKYFSSLNDSDEQFLKAPVRNGSNKNKAKVSDVANVDKVAESSTTELRSSSSTESKADTSDVIDVTKLAQILTASFSDKDGIPSKDQMGFDVTFKNLNDPAQSTCHCDVLSIDCLHTIACIPHLHNPQYRHALAWIGLQMRHAIKSVSTFDGVLHNDPYIPLGKNIQYSSIDTWKGWREQNILPKAFDRHIDSIFVNADWYRVCRENKDKSNTESAEPHFRGLSCFMGRVKDTEDRTKTFLESHAVEWFKDSIVHHEATKHEVRKLLKEFVRDHQPHLKDPETGNFKNIDDIAGSNKELSSLGYLLMFSHVVRMVFNIRPFVKEIYAERLTSVGKDGNSELSPASKIGKKNARNGNDDNEEPFNVALHMRRGDSCHEPSPSEYQSYASPINSPGQTGADRHCYKTKVYMNALRKIRLLVPRTRPLHVYLATDDVGDMISEIVSKKHESRAEEEVVDVERWHFVKYSRDVFNYEALTIEDVENKDHQPKLGETAIIDLWHLSHGHAFVGHLGSRYGKVAWLLATARHNTFIPFFSVDGHSVCCEIDEACGKMKPFVTVDNCLTFGHEYIDFDHNRNNGTYFQEGSLARRTIFLEQQEEKKSQSNRDATF